MGRIPDELAQGLKHHQAGQLQEAEAAYQRILRVDPRHADALHLLGVIGQQRGEPALAAELIGKAIATNSSNAVYHTNLGAAQQALGNFRDSEESYRRAIRLQPRYPDAHFNLGVLLAGRGEIAAAQQAYEQAVRIKPELAEAHVNLGNIHKSLGRLNEAEAAFRRAIRARPSYSLAHYNLGNLFHDQQRLEEAVDSYERALKYAPRSLDILYNLGTACLAAEQVDRAVAALQQAIAIAPDNARAHNNLGLARRKEGNLSGARQCFERACTLSPPFAEAHNNLGSVQSALGNFDAAVESYRKAIELSPRLTTAHTNLGIACRSLGDHIAARDAFEAVVQCAPEDAEGHVHLGSAYEALGEPELAAGVYEIALELDPEHSVAAFNLGNALASAGQLAEAAEAYRRAIRLRSDFAQAHNNLGQVLQSLGNLEQAEASYRRALDLDPEYATACNNLGAALYARGRWSDATELFYRALSIDPRHEQANTNLGSLLKNRGQVEGARACFERVLADHPDRNKVRVLQSTMLRPVYRSMEELHATRTEFEQSVASLLDSGIRLDPRTDEMPGIFFLPYQGLNDRDIQLELARLYPVERVPPERVVRQRSPGDKLRIGFISHHFRNHTIAYLMQGMIARLSRSKFEVTVLSVGDHRDDLAESIRRQCDHYVVLPENLAISRKRIAEAQLDVLFYADVGMDPFTYTLAFHRFAPVQCVTWGHPVTTGIPNMDYFISSDLVEPPGAQHHYTERLVKLNGLPTYYLRPQVRPGTADRSRYGIPADCHLYLCPQSLFKIHPEFDPLLAEILRRDPQGLVAFIEGLEPEWTGLLEARIRREHPDIVDRVRFLPKQNHDDFLGLLSACDVMLDPLHFGGGNTTYEGLALGTPIVTLPSEYMRGRVTAACYRKMGLTDCIARNTHEYVDFALRLGADPNYRRTMQSRILAQNHVLYEDEAMLRELETFLEDAVARVGSGSPRAGLSTASEETSDSLVDPTVPSNEIPPEASVSESHDSAPTPGSTSGRSRRKLRSTPANPPAFAHRQPLASRPFRSVMSAPHSPLPDILRACTCPACGHHVAVPFYDGGKQPLATVAWPRSPEEARGMKRLPLTFMRCVECGHVYNRDFNYAEVPYSEKPNLMFNRGAVWTDHLRNVRDLILEAMPAQPVVVEVGCGEGHLLRALAECRPTGRYIGFDPSNAINTGDGLIEGRRELFEPTKHLAELRPDLIVSRHVLEHLMNPLGFVQAISFAASWENVETRLFIEVPCIDQVIRIGRTVDFFYEHNSNFTTTSLERLLSRCASDVEKVARGYNDEVVYGLARFCRRRDQVQFAAEAIAFRERTERQRLSMAAELEQLLAGGAKVVVWGGTGKAAAFINQHGLDATRFPLVVDSDADKAGTFVPGMGQEIRFRDCLLTDPVDVILIATQWRAGDIVLEIQRTKIPYRRIVLEHDGRLVDYFNGEHPYRIGEAA